MPELVVSDADLIIGRSFGLLVFVLSMLSGFGSYLHNFRRKKHHGIVDFLAEIILALVVGLTVAYICEYHKIDRAYTCAIVLILSNNASDTMNFIKTVAMTTIGGLAKLGGKR